MLNSEQNNNWKQDLEQIELQSSDLSFEKTAAWDKLYQRIEKPEGKKRALWFKWAAVFIALSSLVTYYIINLSSSKNSIESPITIKESKSNETLNNQLPIESTLKKESLVSKESNEPIQQQEKQINRRGEVKAIPVSATTIAQLPSETLITSNSITISAPLADTFRNITIASPPEKKKLRVIHINDYAVPVKPEIFMANNLRPDTRNLLRLHAIPAANESNETLSSQATPTIKIKLSPQN